MEHGDIIQEVLCRIKAIKGVENAYILDEKDKDEITTLEKKVEGAILMGLGVGDNKGVREVLSRQIILAFTTNLEYAWPSEPHVVLMQYGEKLGEDIYDQEKLEECKKCEDMLVMGNFVMYKKAIPKPKDSKKEPLTVLLPPQKCPEVECIKGLTNVVMASPSTPTDEYLRQKLGLKAGTGLGTGILGFDFC